MFGVGRNTRRGFGFIVSSTSLTPSSGVLKNLVFRSGSCSLFHSLHHKRRRTIIIREPAFFIPPIIPLLCQKNKNQRYFRTVSTSMPVELKGAEKREGEELIREDSNTKRLKEDQDNKGTTMAPVVESKEMSTSMPLLGEVDMEVVEIKEVPKLFFAKLTEKAHVPTRGSKVAAGYDLKSAYKYTVPAKGSCLIKTDIQIKLPSGYYGRVAPRSGLALKNKIDVGAGVIDEDYRGNVGVILFNHADIDFEVNEGDRVAQLICEKICYPELVELKSLDETERGEGGFGSTGVASGTEGAGDKK